MDEVTFTDEQKKFIFENYESGIHEIKQLTSITIEKFFPDVPDKFKDGRSIYGRTIKAILKEQNLETKGAHQYEPVEVSLTESDKKFVQENRSLMSSVEMTRIIESDPTITNLHKKAKLIEEYNQSLESTPIEESGTNDQRPIGEYKPPKIFNAALSKVNKYILNGIDKHKITGAQRSGLNSLIRYLDTYRFQHQINSYDAQEERDLFESSFVRYTSDKSDLSQEEVDQYIVLSTEVVIASNIQRRIRRLSELLDGIANDPDGRRMSMSLVDAISSAQTEYNQCVNRQQKLLESLKEKRSDRLKKEIKNNASILNLVQLWKDEESRAKLIKLAELRKKVVEKEVERLSSMDQMKARILGLSEDEAING